MLPKLAALLLAASAAGGYAAFADPPALPEGETHTVTLAATDHPVTRADRTLWGKGQVLPPEYRSANLTGWDRYGLRPAPEGYHWVSVGRNAYIVDVSSGEIAGAFIGVLTD
ncbi:RcnB family protein [Hyphomonas sp.]|uniref:RcnB family protein n=1 Tax=Hyphomonas sp. TaxID=87 RepID=UPI00391B1460